MTNNQQAIINSLISEFDRMNQQKRSHSNLVSFINDQLDEISIKKQEFREQTRVAKIVNDELIDRLTDDITDLLDNFGYELEVEDWEKYCGLTITFVGEMDKRYGKWEYKKWYAHKHVGYFDGEKGLLKGGLKLSSAYNDCVTFVDTDALLTDIAKYIVELKKRKL
jgi:hypothetical protein